MDPTWYNIFDGDTEAKPTLNWAAPRGTYVVYIKVTSPYGEAVSTASASVRIYD